ncbi:MAG: cation-translocating P-type ATPase, partial [Verrucomicrobiae bacterium]|nr:cation-translocating P-type ATPase [Verrucomicrobiae bacterium]
LSLFLAMNVMMISMVLYTPQLFPDTDGPLATRVWELLRYAALLFSTPVMLLLGLPILYNAARAGLRGHFGLDALIALGCFAAFALSVHATLTGGHVYYETAVMVLVLVTLGRYLEARAKTSSTEALEKLLRHDPQLTVGQTIRILPGAMFPADGVVVSGTGTVNESMLTGESTPVTKQPGDAVYAGTTNYDGSFDVRITATGAERRIARIARLLEEVRRQKAPSEQFADRLARVLMPVTVLTGLIAGVATGWQAMLAVWLIACPCALGIATPLAIWNAIARAARAGIFIRNGAVLEKLATVRSLFFDKTGTLTEGLPALERIETNEDENTVLQRVASIELRSEHPLARALVAEAQRRGLTLTPPKQVEIVPGRGIRADGWTVGSAEFVGTSGPGVFAARNGTVCARFFFREQLRPDWSAVWPQLQPYRVEVLTGDDRAAAERLGLPVPVHANLSPEQKVQHIEAAAATGTVAMVGDGLNDAPAIARACIGIALATGTDVTRETADVTFADNQLTKLPWLLALARQTRRVIRQNLFWACLYNVTLIPVAALGWLNPILAALAMVLSSALVVTNAQRLRSWNPTAASPRAVVAQAGD